MTTTCQVASSACCLCCHFADAGLHPEWERVPCLLSFGPCGSGHAPYRLWGQLQCPSKCCLKPAIPTGINSWPSKRKETSKNKVLTGRLCCNRWAGIDGHQPFISGSEGRRLAASSALDSGCCHTAEHVPAAGARTSPWGSEVKLSKYVTMSFTGLSVPSPEKKSLRWVICCKYSVYWCFSVLFLCSDI